jgi:hypothetical protein
MNKNFTPFISFIVVLLSLSLVTTNSYGKGKLKYQKIKQFIPDGYVIFDTASGDFNADGYRDYIIVLKNNSEISNPSSERPLLLLVGRPKGKLELLARNDHVVLCGNCAGVFGDPYQGVSIKGQLLSIEHKVGGNWQWSRVITFKYNNEKKDLELIGDTTESYQSSAKTKRKVITRNDSDFGVLSFSSYSYSKGF